MNAISQPIAIKTREELIDLLPKNISIAEIGVFKGDFSKIIFEKINPSFLYLVDFFSGSIGSGDKNGDNFEVVDLDVQFEMLSDFFKNDSNVHLIKSKSIDFLANLQNESLDAIYIDADHSYEAVKNDLELSWLKVKNKGFILGHDYHEVLFPSVVQAVKDFCKKYNQVILYITQDGCPSFFIQKNI